MFLLKSLRFARAKADEVQADTQALEDWRDEPRVAVFREAVLAIEDYFQIRAVVTDVSARGVRVHYATRMDLPFRVILIAPTLKLNCWTRVVWQQDGAAGLELLEPQTPMLGH